MKVQTTAPPAAKLPDQYDALISVDRLIHGKHNPRNVPPTDELRASIDTDGIDRALIVRPDPDSDRYHITDGWQRYQAATDCGWEQLPVTVYETVLEALAATERTSLGREWTTYDRARFYRSIAAELDTEGQTPREIACRIADDRAPTAQTVQRYLEALSLPAVVHPLFNNGPDGTETQWQALQNHNESVRRYGGLSWRVVGRLGRRACEHDLSERRVLKIAANAVKYDTETALEFVEAAASNPDVPIQVIKQRTQQAGRHGRYFQIPRITLDLSEQEQQVLMSYCAEQRRQLSSVVEAQMRSLIEELAAE